MFVILSIRVACKDYILREARVNNVDNYVMNSISITPPCLKNSSDTHNSTVLRNVDAAALSTENDNHVENLRQDLNNTFIFQKYVSGEFVVQNDINYREVSQKENSFT